MLGPAVERVFARHGLRRGEFDVLAALPLDRLEAPLRALLRTVDSARPVGA